MGVGAEELVQQGQSERGRIGPQGADTWAGGQGEGARLHNQEIGYMGIEEGSTRLRPMEAVEEGDTTWEGGRLQLETLV